MMIVGSRLIPDRRLTHTPFNFVDNFFSDLDHCSPISIDSVVARCGHVSKAMSKLTRTIDVPIQTGANLTHTQTSL